MSTGILDTNVVDATAAEFNVANQVVFTIYVIGLTGTHNNHRVAVQISPDDGVTWMDDSVNILAEGSATFSIITTRIRAKVLEAEGAVSTVTIIILGA